MNDDLKHDHDVMIIHLRLVKRLNDIKSISVVLEEAAEEIVDLREELESKG